MPIVRFLLLAFAIPIFASSVPNPRLKGCETAFNFGDRVLKELGFSKETAVGSDRNSPWQTFDTHQRVRNARKLLATLNWTAAEKAALWESTEKGLSVGSGQAWKQKRFEGDDHSIIFQGDFALFGQQYFPTLVISPTGEVYTGDLPKIPLGSPWKSDYSPGRDPADPKTGGLVRQVPFTPAELDKAKGSDSN